MNEQPAGPDLSRFLDARLYPDLVEMGGLSSAMRALATENDVDLGTLCSEYGSGPGLFNSAVADSHRGRISVLLGRRERMFSLNIQGRGFTWADGMTSDLHDLVSAVGAWQRGVPVDDFTEMFPFMAAGRLARAYESGDPVAAQWEWLRTAEVYAGERPLVDALYGDSHLRALFPYISHGVLRLSTGRGVQGAREMFISPLGHGRYRVEDTDSAVVRTVGALAEVRQAAVGLLHGDRPR
ncbi:DUF6193 family natural product biosynthesis protein [Streptomyces sp. NPDC002574]|uniref:DUF6193 family natural product biosynthesis protein n=1 Tax=Streptomyces sp. NPDC002574 TaxID=3364652 RepID=UPI003683A2CD